MMKNCDMCGTEIENGKCSCGTWKSKEEMKDNPIGNALQEFHKMEKLTLTADAPHLGCAMVLFRGDYNDTKKVERFIYEMKKRPYYDDL
jgi:hypothetical protein